MSLRFRSMLAVLPVTLAIAGATMGVASAHQPASAHLNRTVVASSTITIHNFMFSVPASVPAGSTVTVVNQDTTDHTVTASSGGFNVPVGASSSATFTAPSAAGSYAFVCSIHPDMHGTLVVAAASGGGSTGTTPPPTTGTTPPPTGPVQAGDGGSVTPSSQTLEVVGLASLLAAMVGLVMWRRSSRRA